MVTHEISMVDTAGLQTGCPEHHCLSIQTRHTPTESVTQQQPVGSEVTVMGQCVHIMLGCGWLNAKGQDAKGVNYNH